jgi:single-stranded DNA-specific DHH superfamily exonuclease
VRLLTTRDPDEARAIAEELNILNESAARSRPASRRGRGALLRQGNRAVVVIAARGWHAGVIGIVAGRLKEKLGRPAIVIALDETVSARDRAARSRASISARRCSPPRMPGPAPSPAAAMPWRAA